MQFLAVLMLYVALILWVNFFSLQIVYVWLKNRTTKNIPSTALFLRSLAARQHVYLDIVGKVLSLWQKIFQIVRDILQEKNETYKEIHILCLIFPAETASLATQTVPELQNFKFTQFLERKEKKEWHFLNEHQVFTCGNEKAMRQKCQENGATRYHRQWGNYAAMDVFQCIKVWISTEPPLNMYRVIHKSLRDFQTRLRNNQDIHGRKEHINR